MKAIREHVNPGQMRSYFAMRFQSRVFNCPYHYHPEAELTWIVRGTGHRLVGDHLEAFEPGDLVFMGPNLPHTYFHQPGYELGTAGAESVVIQFLPEIFGELLQSPEFRSISKLFAKASQGLRISGENQAKIAENMEELLNAGDWRAWARLVETLGMIADSKELQPLASEAFQLQTRSRQAARIEKVCDWAVQNYQQPLSLNDAAKQANLSPAAFSRFFRRATNRTFMQFINELRIGHACRLLIESENGITQVAFDAGFENLSNFNRQFLANRRMTPRDYRAKAKMHGSLA